jgi:predicted nucleotidyltransferase
LGEKRELRKQEQKRTRRDHVWKCAEKVAALSKENYGIKKLWLFGSLVSSKHFTAHSDIDLFVEDFPANTDFWVVLGQAKHTAASFPINLITDEDAPPRLKDKIREEGVPL